MCCFMRAFCAIIFLNFQRDQRTHREAIVLQLGTAYISKPNYRLKMWFIAKDVEQSSSTSSLLRNTDRPIIWNHSDAKRTLMLHKYLLSLCWRLTRRCSFDSMSIIIEQTRASIQSYLPRKLNVYLLIKCGCIGEGGVFNDYKINAK